MDNSLTEPTLNSLINQLKNLESESKELSKRIGHAKKTQDPAAQELIAQKKQLHQSHIDPLKDQIKELKQSQASSTKPPNDRIFVSAPSPYLETTLKTETERCELKTYNLDDKVFVSAWNKFVDTHPMGNIYYQSPFLNAIRLSMGHRILLFAIQDKQSGDIVAGIPIIEQKSILFGHLWTSIALVNYGGVLSNNEQAEKILLQHLKTEAEKYAVKRIEIRGLYQRPTKWPESTEKASMWLPLPESGNSEELLNSFKAKLRSQIKKGYTYNVSTKIGGQELLDDFYSVFARNMRDLGTPVYGKNLFSALLKDLENNARLVIVYHQGQPASAAFLIHNRDTMEIPWASTISDFNRYNLNMVLYWEVLKYSCEKQCKVFDFGRSSINAPTFKFKKQWGAQAIQHYWYSYEPSGVNTRENAALKSASTQNPKFQLLIKVWKKLPLWLANLMGPHIVKYIP